MQLDLNRLVDGRLRATFEVAPGSPVLAGYPADVREPFVVDVELTNPTYGTYVMTADVHGRVMEPCRRCLAPVEVGVEDRFRVVYQQRGRDGEEAGDEDIIAIDPGAHLIEIGREIRDRLFVETEQYALCTEECRGICPTCGVNLNVTSCECVAQTSDPRWRALESLRRSSGE